MPTLTPDMVIYAYCQGAFPMAHGRQGKIDWYSPDPRAILPLDRFHLPHSLKRRVKSGRYRVTCDQAFEQVIRACAEPRTYETGTWINDQIIATYTTLHRAGVAHSFEAWLDDGGAGELKLVGGLYGLALGGVFFGESMFSRAADASKVCLVHLVDHLKQRGYVLLDSQLSNPHMSQFGVIDVPRDEFLRRLDSGLRLKVDWDEMTTGDPRAAS